MRTAPTCGVLAVVAAIGLGCDPKGRADAPPEPIDELAGSATAASNPRGAGDRPGRSAERGSLDDSDGANDAEDPAEGEPSADDSGSEAPGDPETPRPPADYGQIKPSAAPPAPSSLTVHALAGYEVVPIYDKPDIESKKLGYLRIGHRLMVTPKVDGTGCPGGWYQTAAGGYACAGRRGGLQVDESKPPYLHNPPPPPKFDQAFPYEYAYVHKWNSPMWWRLPTAAERAEAVKQRAELEAKREGKPLPTDAPPAVKRPEEPANGVAPAKGSEADRKLQESLRELPSLDDGPAPVEAPPAAEPSDPKPSPATAEAPPVEAPPPVKLPLSPGSPWLEKGYFIALAEKVVHEGASYWRTARGAYVKVGDAGGVYSVKNFEGAALTEEQDFPFGFAMLATKPTVVYELNEDGKLKPVDKLGYRVFVDLAEETEVGNRSYMLTSEGRLIRKDDLRLAERQPVPEGLEPWERWIDVDLTKQMLVAYEGERPVYVTLVSTGKKGTKEEPFETPTGRWRIYSKHTTTTMDGTAGEGNYSIQDVPWAMYFHENYALHGAFWHDGFGRVRSHGCVNLGATDARWLFMWATPYLPRGWHGVHAHKGSPGTTVVVHK
jgi:lipoprotein-anchoring transpeptidase ErfK/SrfK